MIAHVAHWGQQPQRRALIKTLLSDLCLQEFSHLKDKSSDLSRIIAHLAHRGQLPQRHGLVKTLISDPCLQEVGYSEDISQDLFTITE